MILRMKRDYLLQRKPGGFTPIISRWCQGTPSKDVKI
jgi:hypothetical protein